MNETELKEFEELTNVIANPPSTDSYNKANEKLNAFVSEIENWDKLISCLETSKDSNALFFSAISLKNLFADNWTKVQSEKRIELRKYCLKFLETRGPDCKREVLNAVIMLLVKVVKMSWFDHDSHKNIVDDVLSFFNISIGHCFIGILTLEQIIVEMTYVNKGKTLIQNRRISVNFRDKCLLQVYGTSITLLKELHQNLMNSSNSDTTILKQALYHCLSLAHK